MSQPKAKKSMAKTAKIAFFGQKTTHTESALPALQDGGEDTDVEAVYQATEGPRLQDCLTKSHFEKAMDTMSNTLITTWKATADQI
ncbi:Hypothetical predicted protein, partial [Pelobates cultripes]